MSPILLSVLLTFAHAEQPAVPEYGRSFKNCPEPDKQGWSPWTVFSQDEWAKLDDEDKQAVYDGHCKGGSVLYSFLAARRDMTRAVEKDSGSNEASLQALNKADEASKSRIDTVCNQKLDDGRTPCRYCCKELVGLRMKLVEKKADYQGLSQKEKMARLEETQLVGAKRLAAAGMDSDGTVVAKSREMFDGNDRHGHNVRELGPPLAQSAASGEGKVAAGAVRQTNDAEDGYRKGLEASVPETSEQKPKLTRQGYIDFLKGDRMWGGESEAKANLIAADKYYSDCYIKHTDTYLCSKVAGANEAQLKAWHGDAVMGQISQNELLLRQVDLKR